jgi:hypothetical protein
MATEREFLIQMALDKYNSQYNKNFTVSDCDIITIPARVNFDLSYEIFTTRLDDFLRLHMHLLFGAGDGLQNYRLETDGTTHIDSLGDEIFVTTGTIDRYYKESRVYKFQPISPTDALLPILLDEKGYAILVENGDFLPLETATT